MICFPHQGFSHEKFGADLLWLLALFIDWFIIFTSTKRKKKLELENYEFGYIGNSFQQNMHTCMIK